MYLEWGPLVQFLSVFEPKNSPCRGHLEVGTSTYRSPTLVQCLTGCRWYGELFHKWNDKDWEPGPTFLTLNKRVTPKLLKLMYDGYPVFYHAKHGWGYIVTGMLVTRSILTWLVF